MSFDIGDDTLIESLIKSGEPMESIAEKWEVTVNKLRTYCKRNGISIPRKNGSPEANGCAEISRLTANGLHKSPTVNTIIKMHKSKKKVEQISEATRKTKHYVQRIIDVFCNEDPILRHKKRYEAVSGFAKEFRVPIRDAARMLGTTYTAYQYSGKVLGLMK